MFNSCTQEKVDPDKNKKKSEMNIQISHEGNVRIQNDCTYLQAFIMDTGTGYNHALIIGGTTETGDKGALFLVNFNSAQELSSTICSSSEENLGIVPYCTINRSPLPVIKKSS